MLRNTFCGTENMATTHSLLHLVTFGDCDPAGIVFYPHVYAWFDRAFHDFLRGFGGHAALCARLNGIGLGLVEASARFLRPLRDGDEMTIILTVESFGRKTVSLVYRIAVQGEIAVEGREVRALLRRSGDAIVAADIEELKALWQAHEGR